MSILAIKKGVIKKAAAGSLAVMMTAGQLAAGVGSLTVLAASSAVSVSESSGWFESAYAEWAPVSGAAGYVAYVDGVQLDSMLIRQYSGYWRADAVGLKAGNHTMKISAVDSNGKEISSAATTVTVKAYDRSGFAFDRYSKYGTGSGAYNEDGTLKSNAQVIYVTPETAKNVKLDVITNSKGGKTTCTGIQAIFDARQKGYDKTPLDIRIVGTVKAEDVDYFGSSSEGIQIKGKAAYAEMNTTIEGIGEDAAVKGFGFLIRNAGNVEMRNFAVIDFMDDGISLDSYNCNVWVHNIDLYYGQQGSDADQKKGDGSIDVKAASTNVTLAYNHFYDSGKCSLCGMSDTAEFLVTYHHNWFDHSDSRHPRIRVATVHAYNNLFDGNSKYGVGVTKGASAFVEANYFNNCKYPMMSSMQGVDAIGAGTFSGENGGMIKAYGNKITGAKGVIYANAASGSYSANAKSFDAYLASSKNEKVPSTYKTVQGGTTYNNFDTSSAYDPHALKVDAAEDVLSIVKGNAGRMNGGDLKWTFTDKDNENYSVDTVLKSKVENYKSSVVSIGGFSKQVSGGAAVTATKAPTATPTKKPTATATKAPTATATKAPTATPTKKPTATATKAPTATPTKKPTATATKAPTATPTKKPTATATATKAPTATATATPSCAPVQETLIHNFTESGKNSDVFAITGNIAKDKGTVNYDGKTLSQCLKMESATLVEFTAKADSKLTLVCNSDFSGGIKIDGVKKPMSNGILTVDLKAGSHKVTKGDIANLYYIVLSTESYEAAPVVDEKPAADVVEDVTAADENVSDENVSDNGELTYVSAAMNGTEIDLTKYAGKEIKVITFELSSSSTGSGACHLRSTSNGWLGGVDYAYTDAKSVTVDLSQYSDIGYIDLYTWWNSAGASVKNIKIGMR